jgi:hypothetical protein
MLKGKEVAISRMFLDFRDLVNARDGIRVPQHLQRFKAYADVYESFDGFPADSREGLFFYRLDEMDTSTVFPLLLEIFRRQPNAGNTCERDQILTDLESFLVRPVVCGLSAKGYNRLFSKDQGWRLIQFWILRPGTRLNSRSLLVTSVSPADLV